MAVHVESANAISTAFARHSRRYGTEPSVCRYGPGLFGRRISYTSEIMGDSTAYAYGEAQAGESIKAADRLGSQGALGHGALGKSSPGCEGAQADRKLDMTHTANESTEAAWLRTENSSAWHPRPSPSPLPPPPSTTTTRPTSRGAQLLRQGQQGSRCE